MHFKAKKNVFLTYSCWLHCLVQFPLGPLHYKPTSCKFHHLMLTSLQVAPFFCFVWGLFVFFTVRPLKTKIKTVECLKPRISNIIEYWSINNLANSHDCAVFYCWVVLQNVQQQLFIVLTMGTPYLCSSEIMQTSGFSIATNLISCSLERC